VKSLRLNQARIDSLVEQLYDINKRLVGYEGRLMRLSTLRHWFLRVSKNLSFESTENCSAAVEGSRVCGRASLRHGHVNCVNIFLVRH
jgi:hypothetical protein